MTETNSERRPAVADANAQSVKEVMLQDRFVIEADRRVVGVAVRGADGFRFFTSHPDFRSLDGKTFRRARGLIRRVRESVHGARLPAPKNGRRSLQ